MQSDTSFVWSRQRSVVNGRSLTPAINALCGPPIWPVNYRFIVTFGNVLNVVGLRAVQAIRKNLSRDVPRGIRHLVGK